MSCLIKSSETLRLQVSLLKTIPGIKEKTAIAILSELPNVKNFKNAKEAAAFVGLTPAIRRSGTSVNSKGSLSKIGNAQLRKALYMPAIVAKNHNHLLKEFCARLSKKGKHSMTIVAAAMRKLLHIIFGVLKMQTPFYIPTKK
jgi:transposase